MHLALTAAALTVAYIVLLVVNQPVAIEVGGFYLAAVLILVGGQRLRGWRQDRGARQR